MLYHLGLSEIPVRVMAFVSIFITIVGNLTTLRCERDVHSTAVIIFLAKYRCEIVRGMGQW